MRASRGEIKI